MDEMLVAQKSHVIKLQRDAILEVKRSVGASKNTHFFKKRCEIWGASIATVGIALLGVAYTDQDIAASHVIPLYQLARLVVAPETFLVAPRFLLVAVAIQSVLVGVFPGGQKYPSVFVLAISAWSLPPSLKETSHLLYDWSLDYLLTSAEGRQV